MEITRTHSERCSAQDSRLAILRTLVLLTGYSLKIQHPDEYSTSIECPANDSAPDLSRDSDRVRDWAIEDARVRELRTKPVR
jgi:hypothetical protein